jgi:hypothetical protein
VGIKDVDEMKLLTRPTEQGWMLKKGNRAIQGYHKRWVEIQASGVLTYFKSPKGIAHGSINLRTSAIHADHDALVLDIDSGKNIYHFKLENTADFNRWITAIEFFGLFHAQRDMDTEENAQAEEYSKRSSRVANIEGSIAESPFEGDYRAIEAVVELLKTKLEPIVDSIDEKKDFGNVIHETKQIVDKLIQKLQAIAERQALDEKESTVAMQRTEAAFLACLNDNNRIRRNHGMETVERSQFYLDDVTTYPALRTIRASFSNLTSKSLDRSSEIYYDVEDGMENSFDGESRSSSMISRDCDNIIIEEETEVHSNDKNLNNTGNIETSSLNIISPEAKAKKVVVIAQSRTKLPFPAASMDDFNFFGILRNNIGKDLSTISMPIYLNEPISVLQKLCEELEYSELLDKAAITLDPVDRMCIIAGFYVSAYASTVHRAGRKPVFLFYLVQPNAWRNI